MNKLQQESLQAKDTRFLTDIVDKGIANDEVNHASTQKMLKELLQLSSELLSAQKTDISKRISFDEKERLYMGVFRSFEFLADRFCLLSHTSKMAEFFHLPALIERFKYTLHEFEKELNKGFFDILCQLLSVMNIEDDEHLNGLEEKSLGLKQINFRVPYNAFRQAYEAFMSCRYNDDFDFWYYMEFQRKNNRYDPDSMLVKGLEEIAELAKNDVLNPMTAKRFYQECLKIYIIGSTFDEDELDFNELLSAFPQDLLEDYDNSCPINQEAYEKVKKLVYDIT